MSDLIWNDTGLNLPATYPGELVLVELVGEAFNVVVGEEEVILYRASDLDEEEALAYYTIIPA